MLTRLLSIATSRRWFGLILAPDGMVSAVSRPSLMLHIASFLALRVRTAMFAYGFLFLLNIIAALTAHAGQPSPATVNAGPQTVAIIDQ